MIEVEDIYGTKRCVPKFDLDFYIWQTQILKKEIVLTIYEGLLLFWKFSLDLCVFLPEGVLT